MPTWKQWLQSRSFELHMQAPEPGVEAVRRQLLDLLEDCDGFECDRLRWRLHTCECAQDLWLLRGAVFQAIASQHCQSQAVDRINGLVPAFEQVMPPQFVTRV
jgi:hypothetical protein